MKYKINFRLLHITIFMAVVAMVSCVTDPEPESPVGVGDEVPAFVVALSDGTTYDSRAVAGGRSVIIFFNTTCADCRRELPLLQRRFEVESQQGVRYVCISREEPADDVAAYWHDNGLTMPWSAQIDRRIYNLFATSGIPRVYSVENRIITAAELIE